MIMNKFGRLMVVILLMSLGYGYSPQVLATADGPDYFKIESTHPVNLYLEQRLDSRVLAILPPDTRGLKNLGCVGHPTLLQWEKMSQQERMAAGESAWCQVSTVALKGWVQNKYLREDSLPGSPTFDCQAARHEVEKVICTDAELMTLDQRMQVVYHHALQKAQQDKGDKSVIHTLKAMQRGWIKGRNDCWKARDEMRQCIIDQYLNRMTRLQTQWRLIEPSQTQTFSCASGAKKIRVAYYQSDLLASVAIRYGNQRHIFIANKKEQARYDGEFGRYFIRDGKQAQLVWDQFQPEIRCVEVNK